MGDSEGPPEVGDQTLCRTWVQEHTRQDYSIGTGLRFNGQLQQRDEDTWIWDILVRIVKMLSHLESRMGWEGKQISRRQVDQDKMKGGLKRLWSS